MSYLSDLAKKYLSAPGIQDTGHIGSAGLPDYGWNEWLGNKLNSPTNNQGSRDIVPGENTTGNALALAGAVNPLVQAQIIAAKGVSALTANNPADNFSTTNAATQSNPNQNVWVNNNQTQNTSSNPRLDELKAIQRAGNLNPAQATELSELEKAAQNNWGNSLDAIRKGALESAAAGYNRARGIYDEGMSLLNSQRQKFQDIYNTGENDILGRYEGERGNLQASAQDAKSSLASALRAMGMGGSAYVKSEGQQRQDQAKALGSLTSEREANSRSNQDQFNANQTWANTQQSALSRALEDASAARNAAESSTDANYLNNMGNLFQTISNNAATAASNASNYEANPYTVNMNSMLNALNGGSPITADTGTGTTGTTQAGNVNLNSTIANLLKKTGVSGYGLYA